MTINKIMRYVVADTLAIGVGAVMVPVAVAGCVTGLAVDGTKAAVKALDRTIEEVSLDKEWKRA